MKHRTLLLWAILVLPLMGFWLYGLTDLDEGFYAAVVGEMNRRNEWITPYYNGAVWFEKPILLYWLAKPSVMLLGQTLGPRIPSILATLGLYLVAFRFASRFLSKESGLGASAVLGTSLLMVGLGRMMMTDALLVLFLSLALLLLYRSLVEPGLWRPLAGLSLAAAVLAKGPVALILFALITAVFYWRERDFRGRLLSGWLWFAVALVLGILSWYLPAFMVNRDTFVQEFLVKQNLQRFTGGDAAHATPVYLMPIYYPAVVFLGMMPWSLAILKAWPKKTEMEAQTPFRRFCALWAVVVLVFFSISGSKLPHYILPAVVPLSILVGDWYGRLRHGLESSWNWKAFALTSVIVCLVVNAALITFYRMQFEGAHRLAAALAGKSDPVVLYHMGREQSDLGTGKAKPQDTDLPSLRFYLDRPVENISTLDRLALQPDGTWIITREGRISPEERVRLNMSEVQKSGGFVLLQIKK